MDAYEEAKAAAKKLKECRKILTAIGGENRPHLLIEMMQMNDCRGVRERTIIILILT